MNSSSVEQLHESLAGEVQAGFSTAIQVFVALEGEVICDFAIGDAIPGRPLTSKTTFNLHCATKPVVAVAVATALESSGLGQEAEVRESLDLDHPNSLSVKDLVSHCAGLGAPDAYACNLACPEALELLLSTRALMDSARSGVAEYSEISAWELLAAILERLTGSSAEKYIITQLAGSDLAREVWFTAERTTDAGFPDLVEDAGCYFDTNCGLPLLHDTVERFWNRSLNLSEGGYASIAGLGRWYMNVVDVLDGVGRVGLPSTEYLRAWLGTSREPSFDRRLRGERSFAGGFMRGLRDHNFGTTPSANAFGHSGFLGNSFVLAEPDSGLVIGCFRNGIVADPRHNVNVMRPMYVGQLYGIVGR